MHPFIPYPIPTLKDNYVWTLVDDQQKTALIVDPGEALPVSTYLKQHQLTLAGILVTHHHGDHTDGIPALLNDARVPVFGPAGKQVAATCVNEGDIVNIATFPLTFTVMAIPGHTLDHIAFYTPGMLFCGDTLFAAGCGRAFEGTPAQLFASLQKLAALPNDTQVYCAHEYTLANLRFAMTVEPDNAAITARYHQVAALRAQGQVSLPSTLQEEKATNPFLRCDSAQVIASVEAFAQQPLADTVQVFTWLRKWKNEF